MSSGKVDLCSGNVKISSGIVNLTHRNVYLSNSNVNLSSVNDYLSSGSISSTLDKVNLSKHDILYVNVKLFGDNNIFSGQVNLSSFNINFSGGSFNLSSGNFNMSSGNLTCPVSMLTCQVTIFMGPLMINKKSPTPTISCFSIPALLLHDLGTSRLSVYIGRLHDARRSHISDIIPSQ